MHTKKQYIYTFEVLVIKPHFIVPLNSIQVLWFLVWADVMLYFCIWTTWDRNLRHESILKVA